MRGYLPVSASRLAAWWAAGEVSVGEDVVWAVDSEEETEYAASVAAAESAAGMLAGPGRRIVVVVDVPAEAPVGAAVPWQRVAAILSDTEPVDPAGAGVLPALGWYAVQEIESVLG